MEQVITYVGLEVHKDTIAVALAEVGKWGEVREHREDREHGGCLEAAGWKAEGFTPDECGNFLRHAGYFQSA